ncbi:N-succinylarginine dihydrolase [Caulobacter segnis]|uniref:N-succinylarginine dihydrolase n=2 Tax=Caulobacter segnis TaxID=88688 RepID=D5VKM9_CAUST|nr:N-succinylarginine dihydrolase [Caulobacter segnis]ADG11052.1 succinylarginine dihydrolase [Caulobacter segnis ATCC 21756]AVQ02741.1 N-succinylarginine dihydrolase [Caulobacter segnis]
MISACEANCDGLVGPTHSYVGLSPGNLASTRNAGEVSNPRGAALEGLAKMRRLYDLGLPQFVLPPHERPAVGFLKSIGFSGADEVVLEDAWKVAPALAAAACSASSMWAANAATVTPSADAADGRVHLSPANLLTNLHRSLEGEQTTRALRRLFPDEQRFAVHDPLPAQPHFADEGAANHVRLCAKQGAPGVNLFVWGREAWEHWNGAFPARQTREAFEAIQRRHGAARSIFPRQAKAAIAGGAFHNDVVCVGTRECLFFHERAFEDRGLMEREVRAAAEGLFEPTFVEVSEADLPMADLVASYLFNSQLLVVPGEDRLLLLAPVETRDNPRAHAVAEGLAASNGPIGRVEYVDVRQSMRNGGGPACLRLRVVLTEDELAAANPAQRFMPGLHTTLAAWVERRYRDRLAPNDLADPLLLTESREALDELTQILDLGGDFYPFQRVS